MALNQVYGTTGDDTFFDTVGGNHYFGLAGTDTVDFSGAANGVTVSLDIAGVQDVNLPGFEQFAGIESLVGSAFNDTLIGRNSLAGSILGGDGDDTIKGGPNGSTGPKLLDGGNGNDGVEGNNGADTLIGGAGNDHLTGGGGNDTMTGGTGNDGLHGNAGDDSLTGGTGHDTMAGGAGLDIFHFNDGDTVAGTQRDVITDFAQGADKLDLSIDAFTGAVANFSQQVLGNHSVLTWTDNTSTQQQLGLNGVTTALTASDFTH